MADGGAELSGFLEAAGRSLGDAQRRLVVGEAAAAGEPTMAISEVEIDVKATLGGGPERVELEPVSRSDAQAGTVHPDLLSSLRVRFVALPDFGEAPPAEAREDEEAPGPGRG